jgi:two-component system response regulator DesR
LANGSRSACRHRLGSTQAAAGEIAAQLHLSERTVRTYLSAAIRKLGARNRREAIELANKKGWL